MSPISRNGCGWIWNTLTIGLSGSTSRSSGAPCQPCSPPPAPNETGWSCLYNSVKPRTKPPSSSLIARAAGFPPSRITHHASPPLPTSVVTGAAGFLGSHLVDLLLARGHKVIGIDNFVTGSVDNISHLGGNPGFKFIQQ